MEVDVAGSGPGLRVRSTGTRAQGLMLLPASSVTLGKAPPLSELQLPLPGHLGGWIHVIKSAPGWEEGHGERTPKAGPDEAGTFPWPL